MFVSVCLCGFLYLRLSLRLRKLVLVVLATISVRCNAEHHPVSQHLPFVRKAIVSGRDKALGKLLIIIAIDYYNTLPKTDPIQRPLGTGIQFHAALPS